MSELLPKKQKKESLFSAKEKAAAIAGIALVALSTGRLVSQTYESREDQVVDEAVATAIRYDRTNEEAKQIGEKAAEDFTPKDFVIGNALKDMNKWETFKDLYVRDSETGDFNKDNAENIAAVTSVVGLSAAAQLAAEGVPLIPTRRRKQKRRV